MAAFFGNLKAVVITSFVLAFLLIGVYCATQAFDSAAFELATAGDAPLDDAVGQLVLAAREAMTNAAKFSGAGEISVYAEGGPDVVSVYVRDREGVPLVTAYQRGRP